MMIPNTCRTWLVALTCLAGLAMQGCTFYLVGIDDPLSREAVEADLEPVNEAVLQAWATRAIEYGKPVNDFWHVMLTSHPPRGVHVHQYLDAPFLGMWGDIVLDTHYRPWEQREESNLLMHYEGWTGVPIFYYTARERSFRLENSRVLHDDAFTNVLLFFTHHRMVRPVGGDRSERLPDYAYEDESPAASWQYNRREAWVLAWGVAAWGINNDRHYLQLAWIPIPLWK